LQKTNLIPPPLFILPRSNYAAKSLKIGQKPPLDTKLAKITKIGQKPLIFNFHKKKAARDAAAKKITHFST
jgi:hypothetical protein